MAAIKQTETHRRNSQKSTGPKSPQGKARASHNSLKHGLTALQVCLPNEDEDAFNQLAAALRDHFQPEDPLAEILVQQIAVSQWRLQRCVRMEVALINFDVELELQYRDESKVANDRHFTQLLRRSAGSANLALLQRYEASLRRSFYKALETLRKERKSPTLPSSPPAPKP